MAGGVLKNKKIIIGIIGAVIIGIAIVGTILFLSAYKIVHFVTVIHNNYIADKLVPAIVRQFATTYPEKVDKKVALKYGIVQQAEAADVTLSEDELNDRALRIVRREVVYDINSQLSGGALNSDEIKNLADNYEDVKTQFIEGYKKGWISFDDNVSGDLVITFGFSGSKQKSRITILKSYSFASKILANLDSPLKAFEDEITTEDWDNLLKGSREKIASLLLSYKEGKTPGFIANFVMLASTKLKTWLKVLGVKGDKEEVCSTTKSETDCPPGSTECYLEVRERLFDMESINNIFVETLTAVINWVKNLFGFFCLAENYAEGGQWFITADKIKNGELSAKMVGEFTTKFWDGAEESDKYKEIVRNDPHPSLLDRYYVFVGSLKSNFRAVAQGTGSEPAGVTVFNKVAGAANDIYEDISYMTDPTNLQSYAEEINTTTDVSTLGYGDYVEPYDASATTGGGGTDGPGGPPTEPTEGNVLAFQKFLADYTGQRAIITSDCDDCRPTRERCIRRHEGYDFALRKGTEIPAVYSGTVVGIVKKWGGSGDAVWIQNSDKSYVYSYGHINIYPTIKVGVTVTSGTPIGTIYEDHLDVKKFTDPTRSYTITVICPW